MQYLRAAAQFTAGVGVFAYFSGVEMQIQSGQIQDVKFNEKALEPCKIYRMAIHSVMAAGCNHSISMSCGPSVWRLPFNVSTRRTACT